MPVLKVSINAELDGQPILGFPIVRRAVVDEVQQFEFELATAGDATTFTGVPADQIASIQNLILRPDQQVTLRLDGQTDAGIVLDADSILLILGATIDAGAGASNAKLNNNSGATAVIRGLCGGT